MKQNSTEVPFIIADSVSFRYKGMNKCLFEDLSFIIYSNSIYRILGDSGSGKTTLAYLIAQLLRPQAGLITWTPELLTSSAHARMVFQDPFASINPRWRIREWLRDMKPRLGWEEYVYSIMTELKLENKLLAATPLELSGGECQRFSIISALIGEPRIILLDEAFSMLDVEMQEICEDVLLEYQKLSGASIIYISHLDIIRFGERVHSISWQC